MVELGDLMQQENRKLGEIAAQHATDVILVQGAQADAIREGLLAAGFAADRLHMVDTVAQAQEWVHNHLRTGDTVLYLNDLPETYSRTV